MEEKPIHFDGSFQNINSSNTDSIDEPFKLTDEIRVNVSGNPYTSADSE